MESTQNPDVCYVYSKLILNNWFLTFIVVLFALLATLTLLANVTVLVAMFKTVRRNCIYQQPNNHSNNSFITKLLMLSMTVAGVLVGAFIMPLALVEFVSNGALSLGHSFYVVRLYGDYLLCSVLSAHILFVALDTYLVVCRPLVYRLLTARSGYAMISLSWILPIFIVLLCSFIDGGYTDYCYNNSYYCNSFYNLQILNLTCGTLFLILFVSVWTLYLLVLRQVRLSGKNNSIQVFQISRRVSFNFQPTTNAFTSASCVEEVACIEGEGAIQRVISKRNSKSNLKCFRFIGSILLSFSVCWLPSWTIQLVFSPCRVDLPEWIYIILDWLTYLSSTINPVLYCTNKSVRLAVRNLICPLSSRTHKCFLKKLTYSQ